MSVLKYLSYFPKNDSDDRRFKCAQDEEILKCKPLMRSLVLKTRQETLSRLKQNRLENTQGTSTPTGGVDSPSPCPQSSWTQMELPYPSSVSGSLHGTYASAQKSFSTPLSASDTRATCSSKGAAQEQRGGLSNLSADNKGLLLFAPPSPEASRVARRRKGSYRKWEEGQDD